MNSPAPEYVAVITPVREVILVGGADLSFWRAQLRAEGLVPREDQGQASVLLSAMQSKWMGIPFREFTIGVLAGDQAGEAGDDSLYLVQAYNSSRLLAFAERTFFRTPYFPAAIELNEQAPVKAGLSQKGTHLVQATMAAGNSRLRQEEQDWQGCIFLPGREEYFTARLAGLTDIYPFMDEDTLAIRPRETDEALQLLVRSGFAGREWRVRTGATHARSRTYRRV